MDSVVSLRRALLCLVGLILIKLCEYLIVEPRLEQLAELHSLPIKVNRIRSSYNPHPHILRSLDPQITDTNILAPSDPHIPRSSQLTSLDPHNSHP